MESSNNEKPPVFSRWNRWYWLVLIVMVLQLIVYLLITNSFA